MYKTEQEIRYEEQRRYIVAIEDHAKAIVKAAEILAEPLNRFVQLMIEANKVEG